MSESLFKTIFLVDIPNLYSYSRTRKSSISELISAFIPVALKKNRPIKLIGSAKYLPQFNDAYIKTFSELKTVLSCDAEFLLTTGKDDEFLLSKLSEAKNADTAVVISADRLLLKRAIYGFDYLNLPAKKKKLVLVGYPLQSRNGEPYHPIDVLAEEIEKHPFVSAFDFHRLTGGNGI